VSSTVVALDDRLGVARYWHRAGLPCTAPTRDLTSESRAVLAAR
jgi:hypothetical protein